MSDGAPTNVETSRAAVQPPRPSMMPVRPSPFGPAPQTRPSPLARWGGLLPALIGFGAIALLLELLLPMQRAWRLPAGILQLAGLGWALFPIARRWATLRGTARQIAFEAACVLFALLLAQAKVGTLVELALEPEVSPVVAHPSALYTGAALIVLLLASVARMRPVASLAAALVANPSRMAVFSFAGAMAVGALTLSLPASVKDLSHVSLLDALFTATSAVCVTGLVVNDVSVTYTRFGQVVILLLIQLGGLGIMTLGTTAATMATRGLRVRHAATMAEMLDADSLSSVSRMLREIVLVTLAVEAAGAGALYATFRGDPLTADDAAFQAVFHAVSAFCNAGFSTLPQGLYPYRGEPFIPLVVCALIVIGGIGFPVIDDLGRTAWARVTRRRGTRLRLHTRVSLVMAAALIVAGTLGYMALEWRVSMAGLPVQERILSSLFQSVSARTAGMNLVDCAKWAPATLFFTMALMFIGGSPASTAGGIKTTTLAVFIAATRSMLRGRARVEAGNRTLPEGVLMKALIVTSGGVLVVGTAGFLLLAVDAHEPLKLLFEATSAFGTVGLSAGITPSLSAPAKLIIIVVMLVGRVGPMTAALTLGEARVRQPITHPEERVLIG